MNDFSICFHSICYSESSGLLIDNVKIIDSSFINHDSSNSNYIMSNDGIERLELLFKSFYNASNSTTNLDYFINSLDKSIFAFCIPDGYIMIRCSVGNTGPVKLNGFFLKKDESLRTAWKLAKWQLLLLCAMNWNYQEMTYLSLDEIYSKVQTSNLNVNRRYQDSIVQMCQQIMTSDIPFNFAVLSGYSLKKIPLDFNSDRIIKINEETTDAGNGIIIDKNDMMYHFNILKTHYEEDFKINDIQLIFMNSREYLQHIEEMWEYNKKRVKDEKFNAKNLLHSYKGNEIWCFRCQHEKLYYYQIVNVTLNEHLLHGKADAASIFVECDCVFLKGAEKYYNDYYNYIKEQKMLETKKMEDMQRAANNEVNTPPEKKEVKRKLFFTRKNNQ